jgi:hypothetical protein
METSVSYTGLLSIIEANTNYNVGDPVFTAAWLTAYGTYDW